MCLVKPLVFFLNNKAKKRSDVERERDVDPISELSAVMSGSFPYLFIFSRVLSLLSRDVNSICDPIDPSLFPSSCFVSDIFLPTIFSNI